MYLLVFRILRKMSYKGSLKVQWSIRSRSFTAHLGLDCGSCAGRITRRLLHTTYYWGKWKQAVNSPPFQNVSCIWAPLWQCHSTAPIYVISMKCKPIQAKLVIIIDFRSENFIKTFIPGPILRQNQIKTLIILQSQIIIKVDICGSTV